MRDELFYRTAICGVFSLAFAILVFLRRSEMAEGGAGAHQKYQPYILGFALPLYVFMHLLLTLFAQGWEQALDMLISFCFSVFFHICLYYLLFILLLPVLRSHICASSCAMLWMIPNYLYLTQHPSMSLPAPRFILSVPGRLIWVLLLIWFCGFMSILIWKTAQHFSFRRHILQDCVPITDPKTLSIWQSAVEDAQFNNPHPKLVSSPHVHTPLSVGLLSSRTVVLLPQRDYSPEELELIFRHELIHISRGDVWSKFFLVFCTAMCWFNPLMWMTMRHCSEDLELSCDEAVLWGTQPHVHQRYAALLLDHTGDERGFTTCLAASAGALRYRLRRIMKPCVTRSGALIVGLFCFVLFMTCGYVSLAYDPKPGHEILSQYSDPEQFTIRHANQTYSAQPLLSPLYDLTFYEMTGNYSLSGFEKILSFVTSSPSGFLHITLYDHAINIYSHTGDDHFTTQYYLPEGISLDYRSVLSSFPD